MLEVIPVDEGDDKAEPDTKPDIKVVAETKKPARRSRPRRVKKSVADAEATTDSKSVKEKPARASRRKAKPARDPAPKSPPDTTPPAKPAKLAPVSSEPPKPAQTEPETALPVAASAKTQVIAVGTDDDKGDAAKKARKGWWR